VDGQVEGDLRLADLLAALSVATDLGMGHEPEKAVRSCLLATELARSCGLPEPRVRDVYYTSMLLHLGCTASAHELTWMTGDDRRFLAVAESTDETTLRGTLQLLATVGRGTGRQRGRYVGRMVAGGAEAGQAIVRSTCEVGSRMAERLRLGDAVRSSLLDSTEVWDGSSGAFGRRGQEIALPARFALLAAQAVLADGAGGPDAAVAIVRERAGHWFDPDLAAAFCAAGRDRMRELAAIDVWDAVLAVEPVPHRCIPPSRVDEVARVFADMVDLKTPSTLGHSAGVAHLAAAAGERLGFAPDRVVALRRAGLLHDLGRVAVSNAVWERDRALTTAQWEQVRLHPYQTERILSRSVVLSDLARVAAMHHERQDGSGYHQRASGSAIPPEARVLAAADAFQAMTQPRPHRAALPPEQAARHLEAEVTAGRFDVACARAVIEAAGQRPARRTTAWPAGLTDREVEVLRLLASGHSNREIAGRLVISPRTAEHHVQHIYGKIGGSTRAAAALFAMEQGLVAGSIG
jgi:HD-GYP domain-containing protein (c-di-GMP phosphodiesterase class II)